MRKVTTFFAYMQVFLYLCTIFDKQQLFYCMKKSILIGGLLVALATLFSCQKPCTPKEYGYYRIHLDAPVYQPTELKGYPYRFEANTNSLVTPIIASDGEAFWVNIEYPALRATIHCSYKPVHNNLSALSRDAQEFVYNHTMKATKIDEQEYANPEARVYGLLYTVDGNTATSTQFYLTDSVRHFFRGAVYFDCVPNQDSLAPMAEYLREDTRHLIETFHWQ